MSDAAPPVGAVMLPSRLVLMSGLGSVTLDSREGSERPCGARHPSRRGSPRGRAPGSEPDTGSVPRMQRGAVMAGSGPHLPRTGAPRIRSTSGNPYFITEKPTGPRVAPARSRSQQSRDHAPPAPPPQRAARCCPVAGWQGPAGIRALRHLTSAPATGVGSGGERVPTRRWHQRAFRHLLATRNVSVDLKMSRNG